ncbi:MAG: putative methyltransferase, family [Betaproteobacteria bacterium]|nr:putative methyltransferase, family [Betaproteobacteria bacterium]
MLPGQPSHTLLRTAIRRAQHQLLDRPLLLHDPIVVDLVPEASEPHILADFGGSEELLPAMFRALFAMRSRFAEDRLKEAAARGVRQYVMIGAGLDTFPWRQPGFARDMRIFAADHPASLIWTQHRLRERNVERPPNLTFAPVDLEQQRLAEQLAACGFDLEAPGFCSLLGVSQFLTGGALDSLLRFAASLKTESELVLSFAPPDDELAGLDLDAITRSVARTMELGEPWKSRPRARDLIDRLVQLGFTDVFHLSPDKAQARYFADRHDQLRAPRWEQLIAATRK